AGAAGARGCRRPLRAAHPAALVALGVAGRERASRPRPAPAAGRPGSRRRPGLARGPRAARAAVG
ncbi:unnamed protein product, partial [Prorocentrum cordatum]